MFLCTTEQQQQTHQVEVFPAGDRPPSADRGALGIGPKSDSCKDWLVSIFAGSPTVIQRADGKLCKEEEGGWRGRKGREFSIEKPTEGFIQIDCQDVLFSTEGTAGLVLGFCVPAILPSARSCVCVCVIKQGAYERSPLLCSLSLPVSVSDLL